MSPIAEINDRMDGKMCIVKTIIDPRDFTVFEDLFRRTVAKSCTPADTFPIRLVPKVGAPLMTKSRLITSAYEGGRISLSCYVHELALLLADQGPGAAAVHPFDFTDGDMSTGDMSAEGTLEPAWPSDEVVENELRSFLLDEFNFASLPDCK